MLYPQGDLKTNGLIMNKQFTRKEKLQLIQAIREGKASAESLLPPAVYVFIENLNKPGTYRHNGKEFTEDEYNKFCERIRRKNNGSLVWYEGRRYHQEDQIIKVKYESTRKVKF